MDYDVPSQPGDDEDRGRAPIMAIIFGVFLTVIIVGGWMMIR